MTVHEPPASAKRLQRHEAPATMTRSWLYLGIAVLLGSLLIIPWSRFLSGGPYTEEDLAFSLTGLGFLSLLIGIPVLVLLGKTVERTLRVRREGHGGLRTTLALALVGLYIVAALVGTVVIDRAVQTEKHQMLNSAIQSMPDRRGLDKINRGSTLYSELVVLHESHTGWRRANVPSVERKSRAHRTDA